MENLILTYFVRSWGRHSGIMGRGIGLWKREYRETRRRWRQKRGLRDIEGSWYRLEGHIQGGLQPKRKRKSIILCNIYPPFSTLGNVSSHHAQTLMLLGAFFSHTFFFYSLRLYLLHCRRHRFHGLRPRIGIKQPLAHPFVYSTIIISSIVTTSIIPSR